MSRQTRMIARRARWQADRRSVRPDPDTVELGLLMGNDGPTIETEREFVRDIQRWKVRHVFAAKFLDWRGIVRQPIAES